MLATHLVQSEINACPITVITCQSNVGVVLVTSSHVADAALHYHPALLLCIL